MYSSYLDTVDAVRTRADPFKRDPQYMGILEHVSPAFGEEYLALLRSEFGMTDDKVVGFCTLNDSYGQPVKYEIGDLSVSVSPTSLRYLYHASRILRHANGATKFVEVGGGYGGLFLAITYLSTTPIGEYHIVDLDPVIRLQKLVLTDHPNVVYHSAPTFGKDVPDDCFFISNYCFSEISAEYQIEYIRSLICRCSRGFLAWNTIRPYPIGRPITTETETPLTFPGNYYVYF